MMLLQEGGLQIGLQVGGGVLLTINTALLLRLSFWAGRVVERIESFEKRLDHLELLQCPHVECPLKVRFDVQAKAE